MPSIQPFRFLHTGDLHLDSPFSGVATEAPQQVVELLRASTDEAWRNVVRTALAEEVDFVLVAGDVFEAASHSLLAQTRFRDGLAELAAADIPSFVVHGNHDPLDERAWSPSLSFPPQVHRFGTDLAGVPVVRDGREIARVYGISYRRAVTTQNLAARFRRDADAPFAVGLLHANLGGQPGHANYAPCSLDDLRRSGMDYWALGHVHRGGIVHPADPLVVYCGNPQGRDPGETGPRGAWVVDVDAAGRPSASFVACDVVRWRNADVDVAGLPDDEALHRASRAVVADAIEEAEGRSVVIRLRLTGRGQLHASVRRPGYVEDLRRMLNEESPSGRPLAWVESVVVDTRPEVDVAARRASPDFVGDLLRTTATAKRAAATTDPELYERWRDLLEGAVTPLFDESPRGRRYLRGARPDLDELLGPLLDEAEALALDRLLAVEEAR